MILASLLAAAALARAEAPPATEAARVQDTLLGHRLELETFDWTPVQAAEAERAALRWPDEASYHFQLASYFVRPGHRDRSKWLKQALWLVEKLPASQLTLFPAVRGVIPPPAELQRLWRRQVRAHPKEADVVGNAASLLGFGEDPEFAERLFLKAQSLEPARPRWHDELAFLYMHEARRAASPELRRRLARQALEEYGAAEKLGPSDYGPRRPWMQRAERAAD